MAPPPAPPLPAAEDVDKGEERTLGRRMSTIVEVKDSDDTQQRIKTIALEFPFMYQVRARATRAGAARGGNRHSLTFAVLSVWMQAAVTM